MNNITSNEVTRCTMGCQSSTVVVSVTNFVNTDTKVFTDKVSTVLVSTAIGAVVMRMKDVTDPDLSEGTNFRDVESWVTGTVTERTDVTQTSEVEGIRRVWVFVTWKKKIHKQSTHKNLLLCNCKVYPREVETATQYKA